MANPKRLPDGTRLRNNTFDADFRAGGRRVVKALSRDLKSAMSLLNELRAREEKADYGRLDYNYPLATLAEEFLEDARQTLKHGTHVRYQAAIGQTVSRFSAKTEAGLNLREAQAYRESRIKAGASPRTFNLELAALGTRLCCTIRRQLTASNPLAELRPVRHDRPKNGRALSHEEVGRLLTKSPEPWRLLWYPYLTTGTRMMALSDSVLRNRLGDSGDRRSG